MIEVRRVDESHWEALRDVRLRALEEAPYAFGSTHEYELAFPPERWIASINRLTWFLAWDGDKPVGIIGTPPANDDSPETREIISMWTDPSYRGSGIATLLIDVLREWALDNGARQLKLWVSDGNEPARLFYEKLGFTSTGTSQPLPSNPSVDMHEYALHLD